MKNLESVFYAYILGWGVFFLFYLSIAKRTADLRGEIEKLKRGGGEEVAKGSGR